MPTTYVVCIDGTWNAPGQTDTDPVTDEESVPTQTNVAKLWEALTGRTLASERPYGVVASLKNSPGVAIYLNGVGSAGSLISKKFEGATGTGTSERIRDAYRFLAERWVDGDQIFGFGFSRGAFAIRSLVGLIEFVGLPRWPSLIKEDELSNLYRAYQSHDPAPNLSWMQPCEINFLGLWDTVGSLAFGDTFNNFHRLNPLNVRKICHALALDEQRRQFQPTFFESNYAGHTVEQVWFAGAHSNIGGGYSNANLSNIALFWMLRKASEAGLKAELQDIRGYNFETVQRVRDSWAEFWRDLKVVGEFIENRGWQKVPRMIPDGHKVHESVLEAMQKIAYVPIAQRSGAPIDAAVEPWGF